MDSFFKEAIRHSLMLLILINIGCTNIDQNGNLKKTYFGITTIRVPNHEKSEVDMHVIKASNLGIVASNGSLAFGYNTSRDVVFSKEGGIFIQVETEAQLEALKSIIRTNQSPPVCIFLNSQ